MVKWTDRPAMTIAVELGRKASKETNKALCSLLLKRLEICYFSSKYSFMKDKTLMMVSFSIKVPMYSARHGLRQSFAICLPRQKALQSD